MAKKKATLDVSIQNVSIGKKTRSARFTAPLKELTVQEAHDLFTSAQLSVELTFTAFNGHKDAKGQASTEHAQTVFVASGLCSGVVSDSEHHKFGIAFPRFGGTEDLDKAAHCSGRMVIKRTGDAGVKGQADDDEDDDETPDLPFDEAEGPEPEKKPKRRRQTADV